MKESVVFGTAWPLLDEPTARGRAGFGAFARSLLGSFDLRIQ